MQTITPIVTIILLMFSTRSYYLQGYFKLIPSFVADKPELIPWVITARIVLITILVLGFIQAYGTIKKKYEKELATNKVTIKM
jgi:hypothetical protein